MSKTKHIYMPDVVGGGYRDFWRYKGRYRVVKGSRGSKKSKTTALWYIYSMMRYPGANLLVVRKTYRTLKDSCYTELKWATHRLGVSELWSFALSPLEAVYKPTGQRIYFRGLDDPLKITSITAEQGSICWMWIEEAYEVMDEADFDTLDESIRGQVDAPLFKQVTLTLNPWDERHWIKQRFFDTQSQDILALTTDYRCNEFLDEADRQIFDDMKVRNPKRYQVAGLGEWGVVQGLIFEDWEEDRFDIETLRKSCPDLEEVHGLDFGYTNDPTAVVSALVDKEEKIIYIYREIYETGMTNEDIAKKLTDEGMKYARITCDSAEPKSIDRLKALGLRRVRSARKGQDSVIAGIDYLMDYKFIIHPRCEHFIDEISTYRWQEDRYGKPINKPEDGADHLMDALRYATEHLQRPKVFSFD